MKSIKNLKWLLVIMVLHIGCTKDYLTFDKDNASVRFIYERAGLDSVIYSFALHPGKLQDTISLPLQIIGLTTDFAREVAIDYDKNATTAAYGAEFGIEPCIIAENAVKGIVRVVVKKSEGLEENNKLISLTLKGNNNFLDAPVNESRFNIILTGKLTKPSDWPGDFEPYSRVKHEFVINVTNVGTNYRSWSEQQLIYYMGLLNKQLYEYNKSHPGNPLTDENGLPVTF